MNCVLDHDDLEECVELIESRNYASGYLLMNRARHKMKEALWESAISDLNASLSVIDVIRVGWVYSSRAECYSKLDKHAEAIKDYTKAIKLGCCYAAIYVEIGDAYEKLGKMDEALKNYDAAVDLEPSYLAPHMRRGNAYLSMGNFEQALTHFSKYIKLASGDPEPYVRRALVYIGLQNQTNALKDCDKVRLFVIPSSSVRKFVCGCAGN